MLPEDAWFAAGSTFHTTCRVRAAMEENSSEGHT
jgi:hypothetical protein